MQAMDLAPQRPPLLLVTRLLERDGESGVVEAVVEEDSVALENETLMPEALFELMAQAYALVARHGQCCSQGDVEAGQGMLVGLRHALVLALPRKGDVLQVDVEAGGHFGDFVMIQGLVTRLGEVLAQAELKLYLADGPPPPLPRA